ncbi:MAG: hypothetical protein GVY34_01350 [Alphaproteobacteria bacterium]|jgi:hypothetical protein|nr:hypothetical protein [Alphaproteobacteria bacterium]
MTDPPLDDSTPVAADTEPDTIPSMTEIHVGLDTTQQQTGSVASPDALPQMPDLFWFAAGRPTATGPAAPTVGAEFSDMSDLPLAPGTSMSPASGLAGKSALAMGPVEGVSAVSGLTRTISGPTSATTVLAASQVMPRPGLPDNGIARPVAEIPLLRGQHVHGADPAAVAPVGGASQALAARMGLGASQAVLSHATRADPSNTTIRFKPGGQTAALATNAWLQNASAPVTPRPGGAASIAPSILAAQEGRSPADPTGSALLDGGDAPDTVTGSGIAAQSIGASASGGGASTAAPHQPSSIQIAQAITNATRDSFDITLAPEELGRVRIYLQSSETGLQITIATERPETLDLLRKNISSLARALSDLGHDSTSFQFEQNGREDRQSHPAAREIARVTGPMPEPETDLLPAPSLQPTTTGMDLRV